MLYIMYGAPYIWSIVHGYMRLCIDRTKAIIEHVGKEDRNDLMNQLTSLVNQYRGLM